MREAPVIVFGRMQDCYGNEMRDLPYTPMEYLICEMHAYEEKTLMIIHYELNYDRNDEPRFGVNGVEEVTFNFIESTIDRFFN